jgi:hypothetical protein
MYRLALLAWLALCAVAQAQVPVVFPGPSGSQTIPLTATATGNTVAFSVTLTGAAGKFTYICGFVFTSGGTTTATIGNATVTGTVSGTLNFAYVFPSTGQGILGVAFPGCIISSAVNTNIVVTLPPGGAGTVAAISAWGYTN